MDVATAQKLVDAYKKSGNEYELIWRTVVQDQTQPLDARWSLFISGPAEWHNSVTQSQSPIADIIGDFCPNDDYYVSRGSDITADEIDGRMSEWLNDEQITEDQRNQAREHMLQNRIGSWCWDW